MALSNSDSPFQGFEAAVTCTPKCRRHRSVLSLVPCLLGIRKQLFCAGKVLALCNKMTLLCSAQGTQGGLPGLSERVKHPREGPDEQGL